MKFELTNKTILIISTEPWGSMHISKHHYALTLAKMGNKVFFLNPPQFDLKIPFEKKYAEEGICIISYRPFFPFNLRFHARFLYDLLFKIQIKRLLNYLDIRFAVLWCFDFNLYANLKLFKADYTIYHPVDIVTYNFQINPAKKADVIFSVSDDILKSFDQIKVPKKFINHGLADNFIFHSHINLAKIENYKVNSPIKIGYVGNLMHENLDKALVKKIVVGNPGRLFYFWGSSELSDNNLAPITGEEDIDFSNFLKNSENVILKGITPPIEVSKEIQEMDGFLILYKQPSNLNSHKIIEYLSTGKVIISSYMATYEQYRNIIQMVNKNNPESLPDLFTNTINNLEFYNNQELREKRILVALENTYSKQLSKIENFISTTCI